MAKYFINFEDTGRDVADLQRFLFRNVESTLQITGKVDSPTFKAVMQLQNLLGVEADGVYGPQTEAAATARFPAAALRLPKPPASRPATFPERPTNISAPSLNFVKSTFGSFSFEPGPIKDGHRWIKILDGWEVSNIRKVKIPELSGVTVFGKPQAEVSMRVHRLIVDQIKNLFAAWRTAGLANWIITYEGAHAARLKKGAVDYIESKLSNHAWGTAFDINATQNPFSKPSAPSGSRGDVRELVAIANEHGFYWGGHFGNPEDGMHFECAKLL